MAHTKEADGSHRMPTVGITVNDRFTFDTAVVTGRQIRERANIPEGFALYRRTDGGGNEAIRDDDELELHPGDHFFSRPPSNVS